MSSLSTPTVLDVRKEELALALERARTLLSASDYEVIRRVVEAYIFVVGVLAQKTASVARLRKLLFGPKSEKTAAVLGGGEDPSGDSQEAADSAPESESTDEDAERPEKKKRRGHGRRKASEYTGAEREQIEVEGLESGDPCPTENCAGRVYKQRKPKVVVRFTGGPPLQATLYVLERLRCNLCGTIYKAKLPEGVSEDERYAPKAVAMLLLLKYGCGFPFHRLERLQGHLGLPLSCSTQWDLVRRAAQVLAFLWDAFLQGAAQGEVFHNDDTPVRILEFQGKRLERLRASGADTGKRKALQTTGIVSILPGGERIVLFQSGRRHAGENLKLVLDRRKADLPPPIQMSDGLSQNTPGDFEVIAANCLGHGRRKYVDVIESFPEECRFVLETLREVYRVDAEARAKMLSPEERLELHRETSRPELAKLLRWMRRQMRERRVEPNSGLGQAIRYMRKRWTKLTLFVRVPGAPIDNNLVERVLKTAILNRKNAYFYKTQNGARVGDLVMSVIATAEHASVNPFEYLTALLEHPAEVALDPARWMPWNYRENLGSEAQDPPLS